MDDDTGAFDHLAAALMAIEDFNDRNPRIVSELGTNPIYQNCTTFFPTNPEELVVTDTKGAVVVSVQAVYDRVRNGKGVCALVGTQCDPVAVEVSSQASGLEVPLMMHGTRDNRLSSPRFYPFTTRTCMNRFYEAEVIYGHLDVIGRNNFISSVSNIQEFGSQLQETLSTEFDDAEVSHYELLEYSPPFTGTDPGSVYAAMKAMKESGFRTVIITVANDEHLKFIADAAEALGVNNGDYYYILTGLLSTKNALLAASQDANVTKILHGSAVYTDLDGFAYHPALGIEDPFLKAWKEQNASFVQRLQSVNPVAPGTTGFVNATATYFQDNYPAELSSYMYDAIMSVGMGRCLLEEKDRAKQAATAASNRALQSNQVGRSSSKPTRGVKGRKNGSPPLVDATRSLQKKKKKSFQGSITDDFMNAIIETKFVGATGRVEYNEGNGFRPTNRIREKMLYGRFNFRLQKDANGVEK